MKIEPWDPARHFATYEKWMRFYDLPTAGPEAMPRTGFVIDQLAMCFLIRTDTPLAIIEGLVGNPWLPRAQVDAALDAVVSEVIAAARAEGFRVLQGTTEFQAVVDRALELGFTVDPRPFQIVVRTLG